MEQEQDNLVTDADGDHAGQDQVQVSSNKGNVYQQYLYPKLTWLVTILNFPFAVILCTVQILLMVTFIPSAKFFYDAQFEYSGIGIIAALVYVIAAIITIKMVYNPSYCKIWLSLFAQCISFGLNVGLIIFASSSPMWDARYDNRWRLGLCNCVDEFGNVQRNGTSTDEWNCRDNKPLTCAEVDRRVGNSEWKVTLLWIMIGAAGLQCLWSTLHVIMSVYTLICVGDSFDKKSLTKKRRESELNRQNSYSEWFPTKLVNILGWIQLGLGMLSMLISMTSWRSGAGWDLFQFCAIGSYALLNFMITMEPELTYYRLCGVGALHFLSFTSMVVCVSAMWNEAPLYPFAAIEMIISGIIIIASFRPIFKVGKLMTETQG